MDVCASTCSRPPHPQDVNPPQTQDCIFITSISSFVSSLSIGGFPTSGLQGLSLSSLGVPFNICPSPLLIPYLNSTMMSAHRRRWSRRRQAQGRRCCGGST